MKAIEVPYTQGKIQVAKNLAADGRTQLPNNQPKTRVPNEQRIVERMIAMPPITPNYPVIPQETWTLKLYGGVSHELTFTYTQLEQLGLQEVTIDFHCVTKWSKLAQSFTGVDFNKVLNQVVPLATAKYVIFEGSDNYTTNLVLQELIDHTCILATKMDGKAIEPKYGGPVRAVVPHLYGWKSTKFLSGIRFVTKDEPGFWESVGYHNHGDPWLEERYA